MTDIREITPLEAYGYASPLPTPSSRTNRSTQTNQEDGSTPPLKILVVEDDNISRIFLSKILQKKGYDVISVKNGKEALETLRSEKAIDILLTDIQMPELDGLEMTKTLRSDKEFASKAHLPIIAMTAYGSKNDKEKYLKAGMDDYMQKPIDPKLLHIVLEQVSNRSH